MDASPTATFLQSAEELWRRPYVDLCRSFLNPEVASHLGMKCHTPCSSATNFSIANIYFLKFLFNITKLCQSTYSSKNHFKMNTFDHFQK